jgi:hypothetical protein
MRVLIVGEGPETASIGEGLEAAGVAVERRGANPPAADGSEELLEIARDLVDVERVLSEDRADAVLVGSHSSAALARVIRQLADTALAPDPAAIVNWLRGGYSPRA